MRFFIYSRKSLDTGKGESIENQATMCREYIRMKFKEEEIQSVTVYEDEGFSAKDTGRPAFQRMLRELRNGKADCLVCYRLDRISRNVSNFSALVEELYERGISFICIREEFDTSKPMGRAMMYIASVFAQLERETIAQRVRDNMLVLARSGIWLGGPAPLGFVLQRSIHTGIDGRQKPVCILEPDPQRIGVVREIFDTFLERRSLTGVYQSLLEKKHCIWQEEHLSLEGIKKILQNPVYCSADKVAYDYFKRYCEQVSFEPGPSYQNGLIAYNKRAYHKKGLPRNPIKEWIVAKGYHPGLLSGEKWVAVQQILETNRPQSFAFHRTNNPYALLSGVIRCGICGARMFAKPRRSKNADPERFDYICQTKLRDGAKGCCCQNLLGNQADQKIQTFLLPYLKVSPDSVKSLKHLKEELVSQEKLYCEGKKEQQIKHYQKKAETLCSSFLKSRTEKNITQLLERVSWLDAQLKRLKKEEKEENQELEAEENERMEKWAEYLANPQMVFCDSSIPEKRALLQMMIEKIIWDGENLHLYWKKSVEKNSG